MGPALINQGFHQVDNPVSGAVVIMRPAFGHGIKSPGHVGIIESAQLKNGNWSISVRGANQTDSDLETELGCNNVNTIDFAPYAESTSKDSIAYFVR